MTDEAMAGEVEGLMVGSADMNAVLKKHSGWFIGVGIVMVILGVIAVAVPPLATLAAELILGWVFLIGGVFEIIHAVTSWKGSGPVIRLLSGVLSLLVGIMLLAFPLQGILTLTLLVAALFIVQGVFKLIWTFQVKPLPNWGWVLFDGIVSLVLGVIIYAEWPKDASWAIGLLVGIGLIFGGWTRIMLAMAFRGLGDGEATEGDPAVSEDGDPQGPRDQGEPSTREEQTI